MPEGQGLMWEEVDNAKEPSVMQMWWSEKKSWVSSLALQHHAAAPARGQPPAGAEAGAGWAILSFSSGFGKSQKPQLKFLKIKEAGATN